MHAYVYKKKLKNQCRPGRPVFFLWFSLSLPFFVRVPPHCSGNNLPSSLLSVTFTHVGNPILIKQKICLCICNWCRGTWSLCTVHTRLFEMHSLNASWNKKSAPTMPCHAALVKIHLFQHYKHITFNFLHHLIYCQVALNQMLWNSIPYEWRKTKEKTSRHPHKTDNSLCMTFGRRNSQWIESHLNRGAVRLVFACAYRKRLLGALSGRRNSRSTKWTNC